MTAVEEDSLVIRRFFGTGGLSVILPFHCVGKDLTWQNLNVLASWAQSIGLACEWIPVDDGSTDDTAEAIASFAATHPACHPIFLPENQGKGAAILTGLQYVTKTWTLLLDGDLDLDPAMLPAFCLTAETTQAKIIVGSKRHACAEVKYPLHRRFFSTLYHGFTQCLLPLGIHDTQSGMKLFHTHELRILAEKVLVKRFAFDLEFLAAARESHIPIAEAPVRVLTFGNKWGCLSWKVFWRTLLDTLAIAYRARILHYYASLTPLPPLPDPSHGPLFSIIVACPGDSPVLRKLIDALKAQTYRNFEVLFLPDRLLVRPETNYRFRILATGSVRPAKKRNLGAAAAVGDILVFIDDDAYPRPDWLAQAARRFTNVESTPTIDALGGPGLTPPEDPPNAQLSGLIFASPLVSGNFRYRYFIQGALRRVEDFPSCNLFVRKAAFNAIHGFREDFWPGEDTLLCADLQQQGYTLWYDPRVVVYHHRRPIFGPHLRQVGRYALHRGYFARCIGFNSRRLSYSLPSLFVIGVLAGPVAALWAPFLFVPYIFICGLYLLTTLTDAILEAPAWRWIIPLWMGIIGTHFWYGVRFIQGFCSLKMPCRVRPFDHR